MADIRLTRHETVRRLTMTAPDRRNALDAGMLADMAAAVREVREDPDARVLVVAGEGRSFCAGADLSSLFGDPARHPGEIRQDLKRVYRSFLGLTELSIPTIAAVQGHAVGAGVNIALACDVVVAAPDASFSVSFTDIGLHPGGGCSWLLTQRVGAGRALDLILRAGRLGGVEALEAGLATQVAEDPRTVADELATRYARLEPTLLRDVKAAVRIASTSDLAATLEFESWAQAASVGAARFQEFLREFAARGER